MKKKIIIVADSLEIGGIEKSLISMLEKFDYNNYEIDLMLYRKEGELLNSLDKRVNLLESQEGCQTFGIPIKNLIKDGYIAMALGRIYAKTLSNIIGRIKGINEIDYYQVQLMYKYTHCFLDKEEKEYDIAIGYVWPHNYILDKVSAKVKIGWIHTDYSTININRKIDFNMWSKLDYIVSISEDCTRAFLSYYPSLKYKVILVENLISPEFIKKQSNEEINTNINKEDFNLLSIGRICNQKGFDLAVEILAKVHEKGYKNIKWHIVGFGPDENKLRKLISLNNLNESFILHGKQINPYPYIKECDLYVQPSRYEGKAVTVNEAKILSKAIIIANYETSSSQISNMEDGIIAELNTEEMSKVIINLYNDEKLRGKLSRNCKKISYDNIDELKKLYEIMG